MTSKDITLLASKVCVWHEICLTVSSYLWIDRLKTFWQQHYDKCDMEEREKLKKNHPNDVINGWPRTFIEIWDLNKHWNLLNLNLMRKTYFRWNRFFVVKLVLKHFRKKIYFRFSFPTKKSAKDNNGNFCIPWQCSNEILGEERFYFFAITNFHFRLHYQNTNVIIKN